jgi:hypothetical protein
MAYTCTIGIDNKKYYYLNGKRISVKVIPATELANIPCTKSKTKAIKPKSTSPLKSKKITTNKKPASAIAKRKKSPSPAKTRSPSPKKTRTRTPSPVKPRIRTPSPVKPRIRTPSPVKPRTRTPSPVKPRTRTPSPVKPRTPSPIRQKASSPIKSRPRSPSPLIKERIPSPIRESGSRIAKKPSPAIETPSPPKRRKVKVVQRVSPDIDVDRMFSGRKQSKPRHKNVKKIMSNRENRLRKKLLDTSKRIKLSLADYCEICKCDNPSDLVDCKLRIENVTKSRRSPSPKTPSPKALSPKTSSPKALSPKTLSPKAPKSPKAVSPAKQSPVQKKKIKNDLKYIIQKLERTSPTIKKTRVKPVDTKNVLSIDPPLVFGEEYDIWAMINTHVNFLDIDYLLPKQLITTVTGQQLVGNDAHKNISRIYVYNDIKKNDPDLALVYATKETSAAMTELINSQKSNWTEDNWRFFFTYVYPWLWSNLYPIDSFTKTQ